jgi:hypothetical protein
VSLPRGCTEDSSPDIAAAVRVVLALLESAGASRLPGISCSSVQIGLPLLIQAVAFESTECLTLWVPVSYALLVSRVRPNGNGHCYAPRCLPRQQVVLKLALGVKLLCGRFPHRNI